MSAILQSQFFNVSVYLFGFSYISPKVPENYKARDQKYLYLYIC